MPDRHGERRQPMPQWTVDAPTRLAFDDVTALRVRAIAGSVAILATSEAPALDITRVSGRPLTVTHEDGLLTISYEDLTWDGLLEWLRPRNHSAELMVTVPRDCPAQVGVVAATAIVSGVTARTSVKSVSGAITLDGLNGKVDARTVGGDVEAQDINGQVTFNSISGDLTLAGGSLDRLDAKTVTGRVTADVYLGKPGDVRVAAAGRAGRPGQPAVHLWPPAHRVRLPAQLTLPWIALGERYAGRRDQSHLGDHPVRPGHPAEPRTAGWNRPERPAAGRTAAGGHGGQRPAG